MENRLYKTYREKIAMELKKQLGLANIMQVPRIMKINVNAGIGGFKDSREAVESFVHELAELTGQKPYFRKARLSEAGFKIKKGDVVGYAVTLRDFKMWAFLDKLINIILPRVRDFRGMSRESFDESGNYSLGIREHVIFPEVNPNSTKGIRSLQVTIVMNSSNRKWNQALLERMGFPFKRV